MDCIDLIRQGAGRELTEDEILALFEQVKKAKKRILNSRNAGDVESDLLDAVNGLADSLEIDALARKRALQLQADTRAKAVDFILNTFNGKEADGMSSLLTGTNRSRSGARLSIDAQGTALTGQYVGGLLADINALGKGHMKIFQKGALDLQVARALRGLEDPNSPRYEGPPEALQLAQVIRKWQETARVDKNKAGAWIGKEPGYIVRQTHDRGKIRSAGFEQWRADIEDRIDWTRTADGAYSFGESPEKFLREVYNDIVTGIHLTNTPRDVSLKAAHTDMLGNAAARVSRERVLHFKDADAWFQYNEQYGQGNLREAVLMDLQRAARTTALMRGLGPSPQANFEAVYADVLQTLRNRGDVDGVRRMERAKRPLLNQLKEIDGTLNIEGHEMVALAGRTWRTLESVTKLGAAVVSALSDIPLFSSEMAYQGRSFLGSMRDGVSLMLQGRGTAQQQRILSSLGVFFDGMSGDLIAKFSGDELPGRMSRLMQLFFKVNGLNWWTDSWRKAAGLMMSHDLALLKGTSWDALSRNRRRVLELYGIDADSWDIIRSGETRAADGREYLTPEAVYDVSDKGIADLLLKQGKDPTEQRIRDTRDDLALRLRTYFRDRIDYAVINPDAKTRAILHQGLGTGTVAGELLRFITQFKSFPAAVIQKTWGREFYGRETISESMLNFTRMILATTLFGYGAMSAKDMLRGRTPRDPSDPKTWFAAAAQGGALGIYGDFLFGARNRMGGGIVSSLAGPAAGTLDQLNDLYTRIRDGEDVAASAVRFGINHIPGNNLWWLRSAFDYYIGYSLFEWLNPGYYNRMRRRIEKENGQTIWLRPNL